MSAALEFTPAVCVPVPEAAPQRFARPRLGVVGDSAPNYCPDESLRLAPWQSGSPIDVSVLHAPRESERMAPVRLTRRGVVVLSALVAAVAGALLWVAALSSSSSATTVSSAPHGSQITVRAGDTLWSIASRVAPGADPRAEVASLQKVNHLADERLAPGQTLRVP